MRARPATEPDRALLVARWEARHQGFTVDGHTGGVVAGWLRLVWRLAAPLARAGVHPDLVTLAGGLAAVAAVATPPGGAAPLLVAGAVADGLDGAVAVLTDRHSGHGAALDHGTDRVADLAAAAVLVRRGAPWQAVAPGLVLTYALEWGRCGAPPVVTVGERPSRVVCGVLGDLAAAVTGRRWPAVVAALVWDALGVVALAQVVVTARRARRRRTATSPTPASVSSTSTGRA